LKQSADWRKKTAAAAAVVDDDDDDDGDGFSSLLPHCLLY